MKRIFISAGHSASDPGAVSGNRTEAAVVLDFRDMVAHYLGIEGAGYAMDGKKGENLPLKEAVKLVRRGDLAVEFHLNASDNPAATGVETLSSEANKDVGSAICKVIAERLKIKNRGAKGESSGQHSRLAFVQAGGIIVELFFLSNKGDLASYDAVKWVLAKEIAELLVSLAQ